MPSLKFILLILVLFAGGVSQLPAQQVSVTDAASGAVITSGGKKAPPPAPPLTPQEVFKKMGILAYPLIALSLVAVMVIFFVILTIKQNSVVSDSFMNAADALIRKQDYLGLLAVCNRSNECIARVTAKALDFATKNPTASFDEVREVTEAEGSRQSSLLLQRVSYLGDIGSMAPLIGLLGTVIGLISSFNEIAGGDFAGRQGMGVAKGVYEALFCTAAGLIIGIPSLMVYSIYRGKVQRFISELEAASTHLMALLSAQYKRAARAAVSRSTNPGLEQNAP
ncbi:MAG: MotA/TolQ/ExbB proton channel family protein [Verrucomicrobia bacterium]|nr:MotA/TolQ/ExbB proton channel family protein [Verrucomicrobiota bacterium]